MRTVIIRALVFSMMLGTLRQSAADPIAYAGLPSGISNSGEIVGSVGYPSTGGQLFLDSNGMFSTIVYRGTPAGINSSGQFLLYNGGAQSYLDTAGVLTNIAVPGSQYSQAFAINDSGQIVGSYLPAITATPSPSGYLDTAGIITSFNVPGSLGTYATGINDAGQIAGYYYGGLPSNPRAVGFLYSGGVFTSFVPPGFPEFYPTGINDSGLIVGYATGAGEERGFIYDITTSAWTMLPYPYVDPTGINDAGQIVGQTAYLGLDAGFIDSNGVFTFLEVPGPVVSPEPVTCFLLLSGFGTFGALLLLERRKLGWNFRATS